jgi:hypothetical protein
METRKRVDNSAYGSHMLDKVFDEAGNLAAFPDLRSVTKIGTVVIIFNEKMLNLAQMDINKYFSDGFFLIKSWDYYVERETRGRVLCLGQNQEIQSKIRQSAFVFLPFERTTKMISAQEKVNTYLSDGFRMVTFWDTNNFGGLHGFGTTYGKVVFLGKYGRRWRKGDGMISYE